MALSSAERQRRFKLKHPQRVKDSWRAYEWKRQGIVFSAEQYDAMLHAQGGACKICGFVPAPGARRLDVDHNHRSREVRGLLCRYCNGRLGWYERNVRTIAEYLTQSVPHVSE